MGLHLDSRCTWRKTYFNFLKEISIKDSSLDEFKKKAADLALKYSSYLNPYEFMNELESFKFRAYAMFTHLGNMNALDILQKMRELSLQTIYPNLDTALRIFLTLPVTTATCELSFSKLKLVKTYLRSSIGQERLANLAIISIERNPFASGLEFYDDKIDVFAETKARRVKF
ncbi:zinc finger MYM-type protein 1-like [Harmonia axyridis]|uniref:zinc finger MYM-type protein 1-like n=1 Tax=Harmonia axyridis TaxID=115357 RepID=UPI001E277917|nr:zinc finger MYM-type protein 1-like [Harmonia axyridis]